jgi:YidC/Oxa1 family membrane protein insertase
MQTILLMVVVFLGMQLLFPKNNEKQATDLNKALATLQSDNQNGKEHTATQDENVFNNAVDLSVSNKKLTQQQGDALKIQGAVLVAQADLKGGIISDDTGKIRTGFYLLQGYLRRMSSNPGWQTPILVYQDPKHPVEMSAPQLYGKLVDVLSERNKTDLVWGFIPGGYQFIDALVRLTGKQPSFSYAFAALLLAIVLRAIVWPLSQKQLMFSRQMGQLTPRVTEIKQQYGDNQTEMNKRVMDLYKEYGINPAAGCLPAFVQMPIFLGVYQCMLHYQFEFSHGFFLWINPKTSAWSHGILAANLGQQDYVLIVIYGITMTISTLLTPVTDITQKKQQRLMGVGMSILFTVMMFTGLFPVVSGFVLYWVFLNLLSTAQAFRAYRLPLPPLVKVNVPTGGVYPQRSGLGGKWMQMLEDAQRSALDQQTDSSSKASKAKAFIANEEPSGPSSGGSAGKLGPNDRKPKKRNPSTPSKAGADSSSASDGAKLNGQYKNGKLTASGASDSDSEKAGKNKPKKRS